MLANRHDDFKQAGAEVVFVYPGSASSVPKFIKEVKEMQKDTRLPPLQVLLDVDLTFIRTSTSSTSWPSRPAS